MLGLRVLKLIIISLTIGSLLIIPENDTAFFIGIFIFSGGLVNDYANLWYSDKRSGVTFQKGISIFGGFISTCYFLLSILGLMKVITTTITMDSDKIYLTPGENIFLPDFSIPMELVVWFLAIFIILTLLEFVNPMQRTPLSNSNEISGGVNNGS